MNRIFHNRGRTGILLVLILSLLAALPSGAGESPPPSPAPDPMTCFVLTRDTGERLQIVSTGNRMCDEYAHATGRDVEIFLSYYWGSYVLWYMPYKLYLGTGGAGGAIHPEGFGISLAHASWGD